MERDRFGVHSTWSPVWNRFLRFVTCSCVPEHLLCVRTMPISQVVGVIFGSRMFSLEVLILGAADGFWALSSCRKSLTPGFSLDQLKVSKRDKPVAPEVHYLQARQYVLVKLKGAFVPSLLIFFRHEFVF